MNTDLSIDAHIALTVVSKALELMENQFKLGMDIKTKESQRDIVTELDLAIENLMKDLLKNSKHHVIGEESYNENSNIDLITPTWFIDPIDGTTNFISGLPIYTISLGLVHKTSFITGAVAIPALKEIYFTSNEGKAFLNGKKLKISSANIKESLVAMAFSGKSVKPESRSDEYIFFGRINDISRGCLRLGSASANICFTAASKLQASVGLNNKIWDVAGSIAIAKAAGAKVYIEIPEKSPFISYVVGAEGVADYLAEEIDQQGLAKLKLI